LYQGALSILPNTYTEIVTVSAVALNSMQVAGPPSSSSAPIRIDVVSNENRVRSGISLSPAAFGGTYDSALNISSVTTDEELQLLDGSYQWPTGDYTGNLPIAGPNYSSVPTPTDGYRWATLQPIGLSNANGFVLTINGAQNWISSDSYTTVGVRIYARVMQNGAPVISWIDCNSPYPGVGTPGSISTRQLDPAMVAGDINTNATSKRVTFGPVVRSGLLYIRIGFTPIGGQKFASISVQSN
jgi:hypothetical protein